MDKIEESLNKVFDVADNVEETAIQIYEKKDETNPKVEEEKEDKVIRELEKRKSELSLMLEGTGEVFDTAKEGVVTWQRPTNITAYSQLMNSTMHVINSIRDIDKQIHEIKNKIKEKTDNKDGDKIQNNYIISGNSRDIANVLKEIQEQQNDK